MSIEMLKVINVSKKFGKNFKVVDNINLTINKGDVYGFLGPNGAGKTTTIRMILGLIRSDKGTITIDGYDIKKEKYKCLERVGALVEGPAFYDQMSAYENLQVFGNYSENVTNDRINEVLEIVGLKDRAKDKVKGFSLGMKQRLGIAQALLNKPELIILDEPTNGLDPYGIQEIRDLIKHLSNKYKVTILISSHILSEIEQMCNKVLIINKGKVLANGKVNELLKSENNIYEIFTQSKENFDRLTNKLNNYDGIKIIKNLNESGIRVKIGSLNPAKLLKDLVDDNLEVVSFYPKKLTLEDFFFETVKG